MATPTRKRTDNQATCRPPAATTIATRQKRSARRQGNRHRRWRRASATNSAPPPGEPPVPPEDDPANLEYAKRATDLALNHLRNQLKDGPARRRIARSSRLVEGRLPKAAFSLGEAGARGQTAGAGSTKAKENLQEAINSLGWQRPGKTTRKASTNADDAARGLRDSARSAPPSEYAEQYRAFKRRTSRGRNNVVSTKRAYVPTSALAKEVTFDDAAMHVSLLDGRNLSVPLIWFPFLYAATAGTTRAIRNRRGRNQPPLARARRRSLRAG